MKSKNVQQYQEFVKKRIDKLIPVFAKASIGDFSTNIEIPDDEDEFTPLYVGIQIMLEVIREQLSELQELNLALSQNVEALNTEKLTIQEEKAKDEALLASIGDGVVATDDVGKVVFINKQAELMAGQKITKIIGKPWTETIEMEDETSNFIPYQNRPTQQALSTGKKISTNNYYYVRKSDKSKFPIAITATPVVIDGNITGTISVFRDISKEKEIDRAKTEFVSLASHQLLTPLSIIKWYSEIFLSKYAADLKGRSKKYLEEIYSANSRMIKLVNALLNVSRIDLGTFAIEPKPTDILKIADGVCDDLSIQIKNKKINFEKKYDDRLPMVSVDPQLARIIFQNLISNSIKYTANNGKISIEIKKQNENILIKINDNGYGIPKEQHSKIFTKLFRADNVRKKETDGTGLGLYIVKSILDRSGGKIWFESEEGKGSTFYVIIPKAGMRKKEGTKGLV